MFKTSLLILYAVPLALAIFWIYKYFAMTSVNAFYHENLTQLNSKTQAFNDVVNKMRPAEEEIEELADLYTDYRKVAAVVQTSWSTLFSRLELLASEKMRFKRVSIRPDKLVRVSIEGETVSLEHLTGFLQKLFDEKVFSEPNLKRHSRTTSDGVEIISFSLEVDYAGEKGDLP